MAPYRHQERQVFRALQLHMQQPAHASEYPIAHVGGGQLGIERLRSWSILGVEGRPRKSESTPVEKQPGESQHWRQKRGWRLPTPDVVRLLRFHQIRSSIGVHPRRRLHRLVVRPAGHSNPTSCAETNPRNRRHRCVGLYRRQSLLPMH